MISHRAFPLKKYVAGALLLLIFFLTHQCKNPNLASDYYDIEPVAIHKNGKAFAGSTSCIPCHSDIYGSHIKTAHFNTSALADSTTIKGSFEVGHNTHIINNRVQFTMIETDSGFYQKANFVHNQLELFNLKMDVVIGSGTKGQSFLSWEDDELFQIHSSYFTPTNSWTRSPGLEEIRSPRPAIARCIECHATYAKTTSTDGFGNQFDKNQKIYGIDCERCHGPSAKHVGYHQKNPDSKASKYMVKHASLSKQQRLDACALCHSGGRKPIQPPFSFLVGDNLIEFSTPEKNDSNTPLDVHGNQYELLTRSTCFQKNGTMDCVTCHNPHKNERGNTKSFNQKCIGCHTSPKIICKAEEVTMNLQRDNCISCHMPLFPSSTMVMQLDSFKTAVQVRTHLIDIYP
ncbi:multiheme c-type cytochrome [Flagellimonas sp. S174]|uniref:multiheme c-type cytochrome n=1 Tax=Flagellimonas sp. S174 TaxID=3410790 RepID=UPI003BF5ECBF